MKARGFVFAAIVAFSLAAITFAAGVKVKERRAEVTINVNLQAKAESKRVSLWIPYPVSDENQTIEDVNITGNFSKSGIYREGRYGNMALYAEWNGALKERVLTYSFKVKRNEAVKADFPERELSFSKEEFKGYLKATRLGPTDGKVKYLAAQITKGKSSNLAKARAVYDWIVNNMHRDPDVKGCGFGEGLSALHDVQHLLAAVRAGPEHLDAAVFDKIEGVGRIALVVDQCAFRKLRGPAEVRHDVQNLHGKFHEDGEAAEADVFQCHIEVLYNGVNSTAVVQPSRMKSFPRRCGPTGWSAKTRRRAGSRRRRSTVPSPGRGLQAEGSND